jgi:hypothetical protein
MWYIRAMENLLSSSSQVNPGSTEVRIPQASLAAVVAALEELADQNPASRRSAAQFLYARAGDVSQYSSQILKALLRETDADVSTTLCNLIRENHGMAEHATPHLVRLLALEDRAVAMRAAQALASFKHTCEAAYAPLWMEHYAGPRLATEVLDAFIAGHRAPLDRFIANYREHVHYFINSSPEVQNDRLQETSLYGLEQSEYQRAFLASALCHPSGEIREIALRVVHRLNWNLQSVSSEVRLSVETALAFASSYYLSPEIKPDDRFMFVLACSKMSGSSALARVLMDFSANADEQEALDLVYRAAVLSPDECLAEAVRCLGEQLRGGVYAQIVGAAGRLAYLSEAVPPALKAAPVHELSAALSELLARPDVTELELGNLPKMIGHAGGDHGEILDYCAEILRSRHDGLAELVVASIIVRRVGRIEDEALLDRAHKMLVYLSTSSNEEVQDVVGFRRPTYPSGSITRGLY